MARFEVRWIHPLMSVVNTPPCPYLVLAEFCTRLIAQQLADEFKSFYPECYFEVVPVQDV